MKVFWAGMCTVLFTLGCSGTDSKSTPDHGVKMDHSVDAMTVDALFEMEVPDAAQDAAHDVLIDQGHAVLIDAEVDGAPLPGCGSTYRPAQEQGTLAEPALMEVSGIAASRQNAEVLWMHNDSGGDAVLYATGTDGSALGEVHLVGVDADDFEDIALAPCPTDETVDCLWIADVGDNRLERPAVAVYAVPEPSVDGPFERLDIEAQRFVVRYPGGSKDAEALMVAPDGGQFWLITKEEGDTAEIFGWDTQDPGPGMLTSVVRFPAPVLAIPMGNLITGADLHPSGRRLAVRLYVGSWEYHFTPEQGLEDLATVTPVRISLGPLSEQQGEAICYDASGHGLWTVSESQTPGQPLHHYSCRD